MARKSNLSQFLEENPVDWYYPEALKSGILTVEEMKSQYSYLRTVAQKRLKLLGESEVAESQAYLKNVKTFKRLSEIETESELIMRLYSVRKFIESKGSTIKGQTEIRKKAVEAAQEKGLDWINEGNIAEFGQYMDYLRAKYKGAQFDSERAMRLFVAAKKKDVDPTGVAKDFEYWKNNVSYLERVGKIKSAEEHSADDYRQLIEHKKEVKKKLNKSVKRGD